MADYEINVGRDMLPGLLNGPEGLTKLVETVLNQVLEAQMTEHLGAGPHERSADRQGYRNGVRPGPAGRRMGAEGLVRVGAAPMPHASQGLEEPPRRRHPQVNFDVVVRRRPERPHARRDVVGLKHP